MLKKLIPAVVAAVAMLTPVAPAAAWDEVCLHFRGGAKTWFIGQLNVIHGFDAARGMPTTYPHPTGKLDIRGNPKRFRAPFAESSDDSNPADARLLSREVGAGASVCTSIAGLPEGTPFIAYMNTYNQAKRVLCSTHPPTRTSGICKPTALTAKSGSTLGAPPGPPAASTATNPTERKQGPDDRKQNPAPPNPPNHPTRPT